MPGDSGGSHSLSEHTRGVTVILRLDPAYPALWTDPTCLQFGVEAMARLEGVALWQLRLLAALGEGIPESAVAVWADVARVARQDAEDLVRRLGPVLLRRDPEAPTPRLRVTVDAPPDLLDGLLVAALVTAIEGDNDIVDVRPSTQAESCRAAEHDVVVLVMPHVADLRRASPLLADDVPHLAVIPSAVSVAVGPLVVPGASPCLVCTDLAQRDRDASWPILRTQLAHLAPVAPAPVLALAAAAEAARMLRGESGHSVVLRRHDRELRAHRVHDECGCRAPQGNATALVPIAHRFATTTGRDLAEPA